MANVLGWIRRIVDAIRPTRIAPIEPPHTFRDREGREIHVRPYDPADSDALTDMYDAFDPSHRAQGTPPIGRAAIEHWLADILDGVNVVALHGDRIVGHVSFVPDGTGRHELAIFVHQDYQRAGIGTDLLAVGMGHAERQGVGYVWLSVESWKRGIQRFYSRAGFSVINAMGTAYRMSRSL